MTHSTYHKPGQPKPPLAPLPDPDADAVAAAQAARIEHAARIAHEANRVYCASIGDDSQVPWDEAPEWQRESAIAGMQKIADGTIQYPEDSHVSWMEQKIADGWTYGETKDAEAKTHPCLVPFDELPVEQQVKDELFFAIGTAALR